jgi:hypothetical protein
MMKYGMIVTWNFDEFDIRRANGTVRSLMKAPSPYTLVHKVQRQMRQRKILRPYEYLYIRTVPYEDTKSRVVIMHRITPHDALMVHGGVSYTMEELGRLLYPENIILSDETDGQLAHIRFPIDIAASLSRELVKLLLSNGSRRVREKGGAYYVPGIRIDAVEPVLQALEDTGIKVNRISPSEEGDVLLKICRDAVGWLQEEITRFTKKMQEAKRAVIATRNANKVRELKEWLDYYKSVLEQLGADISAPEQINAEIALDALAG